MTTSSLELNLIETIPTGSLSSIQCDRRFISSEIINKLIKFESAQDDVNIEYYKAVLRQMISTFGQLHYIDGETNVKSIKCVHGIQERAVAEQIKEDNIILPILSVHQTITESSKDRVSYSPKLIINKSWNEDKQRAERILSLSPKAVNIVFLVNVWAKYKADIDLICQQVFSRFNPSLIIPTKYNTTTLAFLNEEEDLSEVNVGDASDRVLKKQYTVVVEGYIPAPRYLWTSTGKIERLGVDTQIYKN